jgi:hypothetical protein
MKLSLGISFQQNSRFHNFLAVWTVSVSAFSCIHKVILHFFVLLVGGGAGSKILGAKKPGLSSFITPDSTKYCHQLGGDQMANSEVG